MSDELRRAGWVVRGPRAGSGTMIGSRVPSEDAPTDSVIGDLLILPGQPMLSRNLDVVGASCWCAGGWRYVSRQRQYDVIMATLVWAE